MQLCKGYSLESNFPNIRFYVFLVRIPANMGDCLKWGAKLSTPPHFLSDPTCCVRPQGTLPSKRLRRDFSNYNLYILSNAQWLGWKCGMIWCLASVEWEVVSCPSHVPVAASLPTCLPFSYWAPLACLRVEIPADPGNVKKSTNVLIPCPCPRNIDKCDIKI